MKELERYYAGNDGALASELERKKGFMFQVNWYRVVLDEAHAIKNLTSRSMCCKLVAGFLMWAILTKWTIGTMVCCELKSKYRWALSGTPLSNSVEGLYHERKAFRHQPLATWPPQAGMPSCCGSSDRNASSEGLVSETVSGKLCYRASPTLHM